MSFRENLKEAIDYCGIGQKELAYKTKISLRSIESYLREKNASVPVADKAVRIAGALGVTVEYLVTGNDSSQEAASSIELEIRRLVRFLRKLPKNKQNIVIQNAFNLIKILSQPA